MKNRFMLAPMTNTQSHEDGSLSEEELRWLTLRAQGQFGMVMTCASHVQEIGKGFPGQLGIYSDHLIDGHKRLVQNIHSHQALAVIQLHHAGMRSPVDLIKQKPVCPSASSKYGARALSLHEINKLRQDFIEAAIRAKKCGYDGVEIHGAHGYILTQFLSSKINQRNDDYGGNFDNRARLLFEIVAGVNNACGKNFLLGVRLSPEKFGMDLDEVKMVCKSLSADYDIDFLDISLWDSFKYAEDPRYSRLSLLEHFTKINRGNTKLTVAGKIQSGEDVRKVIDAGVDFATIGRAAILHHDFPQKVIEDAYFKAIDTPVHPDYLRNEGLSDAFIEYMRRWPNFVANI